MISDKSEITISQHKVSIINSGKAPLNDNAGSSKEDSEGAVHDKLLAKVDSSLTLDLDFSDVAKVGSPEDANMNTKLPQTFPNLWGLNKIVLLLQPSAQVVLLSIFLSCPRKINQSRMRSKPLHYLRSKSVIRRVNSIHLQTLKF